MMKYHAFLLGFTLVATSGAQAAPATSPITIKMGDIFDSSGAREAEPLRRLVESLKEHPKKRQFRLIWQSSAPNSGMAATALYDRTAKTLKFYSDTSIGGMGNEAVSAQIEHWILRGVSEAMLHKLERKHHGAPDGSDGASYFTELNFYGARRHDLGSRQVLSDYGKAMRRHRQQ